MQLDIINKNNDLGFYLNNDLNKINEFILRMLMDNEITSAYFGGINQYIWKGTYKKLISNKIKLQIDIKIDKKEIDINPINHLGLFHLIKKTKQNSTLLEVLYEAVASLQKLAEQMNKAKAKSILPDFLQLVSFNDELITLILENLSIDVMYHQLTFDILSSQYRQDGLVQLGNFDFILSQIGLNLDNHPFVTQPLLVSLMHEMAHACVYFTYQDYASVLSFAIIPWDSQQTFFKNSNIEFNPAQLKFKQCVRADNEHLKKMSLDNIEAFFPAAITDKERNDLKLRLCRFFSHIENAYQKDLFSNQALSEVFSFYMEIRAFLLFFAQQFQIEKKAMLNVLAQTLPKLHDYFETDVKRILKNRLDYSVKHYGITHLLSLNNTRTDQSSWVYKNDVRQLVRQFN